MGDARASPGGAQRHQSERAAARAASRARAHPHHHCATDLAHRPTRRCLSLRRRHPNRRNNARRASQGRGEAVSVKMETGRTFGCSTRRSALRAPHEIRPQRLASNDLCRCRVPESHPLRPPRTKPREIPALAPSFSPAPTDDGAPRGHFARAPTSPVVLRIRDHFLCRSGTNSSNKMGVKWV